MQLTALAVSHGDPLAMPMLIYGFTSSSVAAAPGSVR